MNEQTEQIAGTQPEVTRPPVIWQIASVTDERQSVMVVFPVVADPTAKPGEAVTDAQPK